jgi:hypothetical protein
VTTILRGLPCFDEKSVVVVRNRAEAVKRQQIVVWVSLAEREQRELLRGTPRFPAVLDPGFSHNFGIREELLMRWAGIQPADLSRTGDIRVNNATAPRYDADVWLYYPGKKDPHASADESEAPAREFPRGPAIHSRALRARL